MSQTHWKKLHNPDYIGAYALDPGKDLIVTIKTVKNEVVAGPDGKKEECMIMTFVENVKPMIVNSTNAKTIEKLYKTPYIEEWCGHKIQLFADKIKAFGEVVEALRIRPRIPNQTVVNTNCAVCGKSIQPYGDKSAEQIAQYTLQKYGKSMCADCAANSNKTEKTEETE